MADPQENSLRNPFLPISLQSPGSDEDEETFPAIINMQKAFYESHITEQKRRIFRLETRNAELDNFCVTNKNNWSKANLESENEIVELNNNIAMETKRINECKKKVDDVEALREKQKQNHLEKVKQIDDKYEKTRISMYSKIKEINSKINSIEDFKSVEESLRAKYDSRNATLQRKEEELQQILNDIKFKAKLHKESLKQETYKQLLEQCEQFQFDLKHIVPPTVQRLMRENIVLQNELAQIWQDRNRMEETNMVEVDRINMHKENMQLNQKNTKRRLVMIKLQAVLLQKLSKVHKTVKSKLLKRGEPEKDFELKYAELLEHLKLRQYTEADKRRRYLEVELHKERIRAQGTEVSKGKLLDTLQKYSNTLSKLKHIVNSALEIDKVKPTEDYKNMEFEVLASYLFSIVDKVDYRIPYDAKSLETLKHVSDVYAVGDLGFEPIPVEVVDRFDRDMERKYRLVSSTSLEENLKLVEEIKKEAEMIPEEEEPKSEVEFESYESTTTETEESIEEEKEKRKVSKVETISEDMDEYEEAIMDDIYDIYEDFNDYLQY